MSRARRIAEWLSATALSAAVLLLGAGCRQVDEIAAPQVTLPGIDVRSYSGGEADITLGLTVGNPNPFDITLVAIKGTLFLEGREIGPVSWQGEQQCKSKAAVQARIPAHLDLAPVAGADSLLVALVDRREVKQVVRGEMREVRLVLRLLRGQDRPKQSSRGGGPRDARHEPCSSNAFNASNAAPQPARSSSACARSWMTFRGTEFP